MDKELLSILIVLFIVQMIGIIIPVIKASFSRYSISHYFRYFLNDFEQICFGFFVFEIIVTLLIGSYLFIFELL